MHRFPGEFFARDTLVVARELLGARLVRRWKDRRLRGIIVECEAYIGWDDSACHASRGRTPRNGVMFGPPGHAYVYFTYGIHWMLNVVTEEEGFPAAVLIRALQPIQGMEVMRMLRGAKGRHLKDRKLTSGPAKLTKAMAIDGAFNRTDLIAGDTLWLEKGNPVSEDAVRCGPRIGISFAEEKDRQAPWRFWIRDNPHVSR